MSATAPAWAYDLTRIVGASKVATRDKRQTRQTDALPADWRGWLAAVFPDRLRTPFAPYHATFWRWIWEIEEGKPHHPFVAIWPRGFGKSTSAELACAALAAKGARQYVMYVCGIQDQADDHVKNTASLLLSEPFATHFPRVGQRGKTELGYSEGWRRNRIVTASDFTVDAIGLDTVSRGANLKGVRPDLLIFDDIDDPLDTPGMVNKKTVMLTKSILPTRSPHAAVLVVQNLIHDDGIVARLADGRADFLAEREVSGPYPAIDGMTYERTDDGKYVITGGDPTWPVMGIPELQTELSDIGLTAFLSEKQQDVSQPEGGIFGHLTFRHCAWADLPPLDRIVVWVDPAVTDTDKSDAHGIQADGLARDGTVYRLWSWEHRTSPEDAMRRAILKAVELNAECVGVETDQGGDTWRSAYDAAWAALVADPDVPQITAGQPAQDGQPAIKPTRKPTFKQDKAGAGHGPKAHRASLMLADYERGRIVHVIGTHEALERALRRYLIRKPYDLVDSSYYSWHDLRKGSVPIAIPGGTTQPSTWSHAS